MRQGGLTRGAMALVLVCVLTMAGYGLVSADAGGGGAGTGNGGKVISLTAGDNGRQVRLRKGDTIEIRLKTYGTAGYSWQFESLDKDLLEIVSADSKPMTHLTGSPAVMTWRIRAIALGATRIEMENYRLWEGRGKAVAVFAVDLFIE